MRTIACVVCGVQVHIANRQRFLRLIREQEPVRCEQCRRYISPVSARMPEAAAANTVMTTALRRKRGTGAKRKGVLASQPLGRCEPRGYDNAVSAGE